MDSSYINMSTLAAAFRNSHLICGNKPEQIIREALYKPHGIYYALCSDMSLPKIFTDVLAIRIQKIINDFPHRPTYAGHKHAVIAITFDELNDIGVDVLALLNNIKSFTVGEMDKLYDMSINPIKVLLQDAHIDFILFGQKIMFNDFYHNSHREES